MIESLSLWTTVAAISIAVVITVREILISGLGGKNQITSTLASIRDLYTKLKERKINEK